MSLLKSIAMLFVLGGFVLSGAVACAINVTHSSPMKSQAGISEHRGDTVLQYVRSASSDGELAVRINYHGICEASGQYPVSMPKLDLQRPLEGHSGIQAISDIFEGNKNVSVISEAPGLITVNIGGIHNHILETRVPILNFYQLQQYNPDLAIGAILNAKPVVAVMREHNLKLPLVVLEALLVHPATNLPHLPSDVKNVTVNQLLDDIARTFQGFVIYGECRRPDGTGMVDIYFIK